MEALTVARGMDSLEHRLQITDDTERQLVANAKQDCRRRRHGLVIPDQAGRGQYRSHRIDGKAHDDEADHGIREARNHPGQNDGEQYQRRKIEDSKSAGRQRQRGEP